MGQVIGLGQLFLEAYNTHFRYDVLFKKINSSTWENIDFWDTKDYSFRLVQMCWKIIYLQSTWWNSCYYLVHSAMRFVLIDLIFCSASKRKYGIFRIFILWDQCFPYVLIGLVLQAAGVVSLDFGTSRQNSRN